jgi:hypothetical protein
MTGLPSPASPLESSLVNYSWSVIFGQKVHDPRQAQLACAAADISAEDSPLAI